MRVTGYKGACTTVLSKKVSIFLMNVYRHTLRLFPVKSYFKSTHFIYTNNRLGGLPFSTCAPRGVGGVKPPIHFHCVFHAKRGWVGPDSM